MEMLYKYGDQKLSKVIEISNRLKLVYPQNAMFSTYIITFLHPT